MGCEYNKFPEDAVEITGKYEEKIDFFIYCIEESESRQCSYSDNVIEGLFIFDLRIFWINKKLGLGYGFSNDWKSKIIREYKFGSEENWKRFKSGFASQFSGDNS